jgi:radical SAM protein (TIGR01212 family)
LQPGTWCNMMAIMAQKYNDFSSFLKTRFHCKVQKITIDAGFSCPNRDGTLSLAGCAFCDGKGSGSGAFPHGVSIADQVRQAKVLLGRRYNVKKFIAYFQAFTNTYAPVEILRERYDQALMDSDVVGLSIGTRPDCVDCRRLDLIQGYTNTRMVWIEYGLQSMHNRTLASINRRHTFEDFVRAVGMTQGRGILICAHVIIGLPGETKEDILETGEAIGRLGIDGVKIHSLYVVKGTALARFCQASNWSPIDQATYVDWVVSFLERLPPDMIIHRLTGDPAPATLLCPRWALEKQRTLSLIDHALADRNTRQGRRFGTLTTGNTV